MSVERELMVSMNSIDGESIPSESTYTGVKLFTKFVVEERTNKFRRYVDQSPNDMCSS